MLPVCQQPMRAEALYRKWPADADALRTLFDRVVTEPGYVEKVGALGLVNQPTPGVQVSERVTRLLSLPEESRKKIQAAIDCGEAVSAGRTEPCG